MSAAIEVEGLGRYFGAIKAVDGVSFTANHGDVLGFLGPNGAGKSTTMKMLTGFLTPSFGTARIKGFDIHTESLSVRRSLGYLPENAPLYGEMEVISFLQFIAEMREIPLGRRREAIDIVIERTSLSSVLKRRIEALSKGFKRRVGLAQAFIHDPDVLVLDEPTDGLDPNQKHEVRALINGMSKEKCIILSTHILEEVEAVCNRVIIVANGRVLVDETPDTLRRRSESYGAVTVRMATSAPNGIYEELARVPGVRSVKEVRTSGGAVGFKLFPEENCDIVREVLKRGEAAKWNIERFEVDRGELDEVFRSITS